MPPPAVFDRKRTRRCLSIFMSECSLLAGAAALQEVFQQGSPALLSNWHQMKSDMDLGAFATLVAMLDMPARRRMVDTLLEGTGLCTVEVPSGYADLSEPFDRSLAHLTANLGDLCRHNLHVTSPESDGGTRLTAAERQERIERLKALQMRITQLLCAESPESWQRAQD